MFTAVLLTYLLLPVVSGLVAWIVASLLRADEPGNPPPPSLPDLPRPPVPTSPRTLRLAPARGPRTAPVRYRPVRAFSPHR